MKPPKSAGKRVQWAVRFLGEKEIMSARYDDKDRADLEKILRFWESHNAGWNYELVKITTEPVAVETKKRKSK